MTFSVQPVTLDPLHLAHLIVPGELAPKAGRRSALPEFEQTIYSRARNGNRKILVRV